MKVTVKKLPKSEVEIEGELESEIFEGYFAQALKKLGGNLKLDGFRPGKIPENVILQNVPESMILEEMAQLALNEHYPKILESEKIDAISRPEISITKLARKNPLGFKIKTAVLPEIKLADYKAIAKQILTAPPAKGEDGRGSVTVTDEDVEATIMDIRKSRAPKVHITTPPAGTPPTLGGEEKTPEPQPKADQPMAEELPEFNDEFVQALGPFKDTADFKDKLKINIKLEKENQLKEKTRLKLIEKIIDESAMEVPDLLIEIELDKILYKMESDITQMGLKFEDYLKHLNKSREELRKDFRNDAEKKAKLALILNEVAKIENIKADDEAVAQEVAHILEHYKDADPERARMHAENVLTNEKIFQFLETQ